MEDPQMTGSGRRLGWWIVVAALLASPAFAQGGDTARLSLSKCLEQALANNLDLVAAKANPEIAAQEIERGKAPFDGVIGAGVRYDDASGDEEITSFNVGPNCAEPPCTGTAESESKVWNGDVSFSHLLEFGANYDLTYNKGDVDAFGTSIQPSTGFLTSSVFTQETDGFVLTYEMPLLNGFGKEVNTVNILLARGNLEISREDLRLSSIQTVQVVEDTYWDVLATREALRISRLALERAEDLLELNKKKVEVGTLAPIEITEAEAGVASQVEAVIVAKTALENTEDALLQLLSIPEDDPMWEQSLDLTDRPSFAPLEIDLGDAITTALAERPEMASARQRLRDSELSERVAKKRTRHGLDLTASVAPNQNDDVDRIVETLSPPGVPPSNTSTAGDDTNWAVGLRYRFPLRNRDAKASYAIAKLNTQKSDLSVRSVEQNVRVEVRTAARNVESGIQRVAAARKNVELQTEKLDAEQKKFDNGMSTSFEVLTFQNDLADAELSEIRARLDYVKSLTALERSKGTLLEARGLRLAR
jgi:outer membrane protein